VATDPEFNDKTYYTTLGRTLGPFSKMGTFLVEDGNILVRWQLGTFLVDVFEQYNWRRVVFISSNFFVWQEAAKAIIQVRVDTMCVATWPP